MTGRGLLGWRFKSSTPLWFKLVVAFIFADSTLHFGLLSTVSMWASSSRDAIHPHPVPFRDGNVYFIGVWLGRYLDAWWISVGLLGLLIVMLVLNRDRMERTS